MPTSAPSTARSKVTIRLARPEEGPLIGKLAAQFGGLTWDWLDWTNVYPYWLIGEVDGEPRGIIMSVPGTPFGRVDFMILDPSLSTRHRAILARDLCYAAMEACKQFGSQAVLSTINYDEETWERIAVKRGWAPINYGSFLLKRV